MASEVLGEPMIISMRLHATKEEIANARARIEEFGYKVHSIAGEERVVIGAVGVGDVTACLESLEAMPGVERAVRISAPYKFVSREFKPEKTRDQGARRHHRRRRVHHHGGPVLGGERKTDSGIGGDRGARRSANSCAAARSSRALRPTISRAWSSKV